MKTSQHPKVIVTDHGFANLNQERQLVESIGAELISSRCQTAEQVISAASDADALLVQWAPVTAEVIARLDRCKLIVRYGIGVDNVDLSAAKTKGIAVCNVPDYCLDEVADHSVALVLALARQLPQIDARVRQGVWKILPVSALPAFRNMVFATAGFGRIARAVLGRVRSFGFKLAAYDPYVADVQFEQAGVTRLTLEQLFTQADALSLHAPLTPESKHFINATRLAQMKRTAIIVNTARGGLIDSMALAAALTEGTIAAAGLDVFEDEPLPASHPLRACPNTLLTSHVAWFSEASVPRLQRLAAEEIVRGLRGEPLKNRVNR